MKYPNEEVDLVTNAIDKVVAKNKEHYKCEDLSGVCLVQLVFEEKLKEDI